MPRVFASLALASSLAVAAAAPALALDAATWERDAALIESGLLRTLDDNFQRTREKEDWADYIQAFEQGLTRFENLSDPQSLQLMREIAIQTHQVFEASDGDDEPWQDAAYLVRQKVLYTTFVMRSFAR